MSKRSFIILFIVILLVFTGCRNKNNDILKETAETMMKEVQQVEGTTFSGQFTGDFPEALLQAQAGPTRLLFQLLNGATIKWTGVINKEERYLHAQLEYISKGTTQPVPIDVLMDEQLLFFHIPTINIEDEYFAMSLSEGWELAEQPLFDLMEKIVKKSEANLFHQVTPDDEHLATFKVEINNKNLPQILNDLKETWPAYSPSPSEWNAQDQSSIQVTYDEPNQNVEQTIQFSGDWIDENEQAHSVSFQLTTNESAKQTVPARQYNQPENFLLLEEVLQHFNGAVQ